MAITVNIYYKGINGNAKKFALPTESLLPKIVKFSSENENFNLIIQIIKKKV